MLSEKSPVKMSFIYFNSTPTPKVVKKKEISYKVQSQQFPS